MKKGLLIFLSLATACFSLGAQEKLSYQTPPPAIADLVDAPLPPAVSLNNAREWMLLMEQPGYPSIEELSQPELRLAGLRMNPRTNGSSRSGSYNGLRLKNLESGEDFAIEGLPDEPRIENVSWAPLGGRFAFTITRASGIELWVASASEKAARRLTGANINDAMGGLPYRWVDDHTLLVKQIPEDRGEVVEEPPTPSGPVIQESAGEETTLRTYQDLLEDPYDEAAFEYYTTAQLMLYDLNSGESRPFGPQGIVRSMDPSPDRNYILVSYIHRPFSYLVPYYRFPTEYEMFGRNGKRVATIASIPLIDQLPKGFGAVQEGPRDFSWRNDEPATLIWVEAQDGGDPQREVEARDRLFYLKAPFDSKNKMGGPAFVLRYGGITWGDEELAIAREFWWATRQVIISRFNPGRPDSKEELFKYSYQDRYNDPGSFETHPNAFGEYVLLKSKDGQKLFLTGAGASPEGDRPFIRSFNLKDESTEELWRSEAPYYEYPVDILDPEKGLAITRRESREEPPNYFLRNWRKGSLTPLTSFENPYPALQGIEKQVVEFKREDGLGLQGDLYLPKGYDPEADGPLPVLMWAYPREYKSRDAAAQRSGSPYEFVRLYWGTPLYWLTRGYAVFDRVAMPIIGEGEEEPNDLFREQLVANAQAAVDKLKEMGIGDPNRMAVGGHSYGAFMTANLLAHSDLFAAGIARSGAYNRTLTPFGFQSEERTYWDAPEVYYTMSPFMNADKIDEPILLIHGQADNNSGTFPLQSERLYQAINGLGGKARLVMLPHESHGYRARESIMHMLWEQDQWLEKYVKEREVKP